MLTQHKLGNLDVRQLAIHILREHGDVVVWCGVVWCGVVDNISYVQGSAQVLGIIHCPHVSTASLR